MNRSPADVFGQALLVDPPHDPNCMLSQLAASAESLLAWKLGPGTSERGRRGRRGRQGKSAAFGPAHVVDGVEVLRGDENGHAVAAPRNRKQINASRAVGLRKLAVRDHEAARQ
jgi:hypothetical protein